MKRNIGGGAACLGHRVALLVLVLTAAGCAGAGGEDAPPPDGRGAAPASSQERRPPPGHAWVIFGTDTVTAEVARTEDERAQGLMYREELPAGTGMLFVFEDMQVRSFWMQNTYLPLDIAFLDVSFGVVDIQQMEPMTTDPHESRGPAMFALEVPQGWFAEHGVQTGARPKVVFGS